MVKNFYHKLINSILLLVLIALAIINIWQYNRTEANQLKILNAKQSTDLVGGDIGNYKTPPEGMIWYSGKEGNLLKVDHDAWLPKDHKQGGTLKLLMASDPKGFNYLIESSTDVSTIQDHTNVSLVSRHKNEVTTYGPALATYYGRSDDYLTYYYELRPDIFWHKPALTDDETSEKTWLTDGESCKMVGKKTAETLKSNFPEMADKDIPDDRNWINGRCRVTAHDVIFYIEMLMNDQVAGAASSRSYFADLDMDKVKATSDFAFQIQFKNKKYKNDLVSKWIGTLPEFLYAYNSDGDRFDNEIIGTKFSEHWYNPRGIGNGPYRFIEYIPKKHIKLEKDPLYPLGGNSFDEIIVKLVKDPSQHPRMLQKSAEAESEDKNDGVHLTSLGSGQYKQVFVNGEEDSPFRDGTIPHDYYWTYGYGYIGWNADKPYFSDKRVRQAMSHALRADEILEKVRNNMGMRTTGPITPGLPYYDDTLEPIPYNLDKARQLLSDAGWTDTDKNGIVDRMIDGNKIEFEFTFNIVSHPTHKKTANILKEDLKEIGIKCNLQAMEWANFQKVLQTKKFDAVMLGWGTSPDVDFDQIWHSRHADEPQSSNYVGFRNKEADEIIEAMEYEFDMDKRYELAKRFHRIIYDEQPYTFLYRSKAAYFWTKQVQNAKAIGKVRPYLNPRPWYLKKQ